ncbi:MAG: membrane dipeptidase [Victivallales bacterium]|nr:membrane dipeptidase [Victivallales bacterium]
MEAELRRRKYSDEDIEKVFHKNALRVLKEFL